MLAINLVSKKMWPLCCFASTYAMFLIGVSKPDEMGVTEYSQKVKWPSINSQELV